MKITITKEDKGYKADFSELSGSPICGTSKTKEEAVATLFIRQLANLSKLDMNVLEINSKLYEDIYKFD